jgi:hypothetical protein
MKAYPLTSGPDFDMVRFVNDTLNGSFISTRTCQEEYYDETIAQPCLFAL